MTSRAFEGLSYCHSIMRSLQTEFFSLFPLGNALSRTWKLDPSLSPILPILAYLLI